MTVLERSTRVAISVFLAVNNSTLHCFLNLKCHINRVKNLTEITHWNFISPTGQKISHSQSQVQFCPYLHTSLRRIQCTMTMTKPSRESKMAKRIWKRAERRSVMAKTADIQVSANSGRTTHELHRDALQERSRNTDSSNWNRGDYK